MPEQAIKALSGTCIINKRKPNFRTYTIKVIKVTQVIHIGESYQPIAQETDFRYFSKADKKVYDKLFVGDKKSRGVKITLKFSA